MSSFFHFPPAASTYKRVGKTCLIFLPNCLLRVWSDRLPDRLQQFGFECDRYQVSSFMLGPWAIKTSVTAEPVPIGTSGWSTPFHPPTEHLSRASSITALRPSLERWARNPLLLQLLFIQIISDPIERALFQQSCLPIRSDRGAILDYAYIVLRCRRSMAGFGRCWH